MKKLIYLRCSTPEQNPDLQLTDIRTHYGLAELQVYRENESAWRDNVKRPEFETMVNLIKKGAVSDFYVWDLDRVHRNLNRLKEFFLICKMHNCKIHSFNQHWLEEVNGIMPPFNGIVLDMMISVLGWLGETESTKKSARVKMAVVNRANGTFSYKGNKWGRKPLPKQTVNRVLELHRKEQSVRQIASEVFVYDKHKNARNISKSAVHKIIAENSL